MEQGDVSPLAQFQDTARSRQQGRHIAATISLVRLQVFCGPVSAMQEAHCTSRAYHAGLEATEDVNKVAQDTVNIVPEDRPKSVSSAKRISGPVAQPMVCPLSPTQNAIEPASINSAEQMGSTCVIA